MVLIKPILGLSDRKVEKNSYGLQVTKENTRTKWIIHEAAHEKTHKDT
jgi:hypothetical protein